MTEKKLSLLKRKLQESRYRLIIRNESFAGILADMLFVAVKDVGKMSTNGYCIYFDAAWLEKLNDYSLDYALSHQLMHIRKGHISRSRLYKGDRYHYACNIIVNSCLAEQGYVEDKLSGIGEIRRETLFPIVEGNAVTPEEAFKMCPMDPSFLGIVQRRNLLFDTDEYWDKKDDRGENGTIVLSPADEDPYGIMPSENMYGEIEHCLKGHGKLKMPQQNLEIETYAIKDLNDFTVEYTESAKSKLNDTIREIRGLKLLDEERYNKDAMVERVVRSVKILPKDWRSILNHFINIETRDYDFLPPDKRYQGDFFLPDFNEDESQKLNVLFMVDISASLTNEEVSMAIAELNAAIEQFNGMLEGSIGFFDTKVRKVIPITNVDDLYEQIPTVGGGTDMSCVFKYIQQNRTDNLPSEIVIMTDGKCDFPDYSETIGIPVLWLLTSNRVRVPWGEAAYFERKR